MWSNADNRSVIENKLAELEVTLRELQPEPVSEHKCLIRDFDFGNRFPGVFAEPIYQTNNFRDFKLPNNKVLRLRLYHPDKSEHITGTDLVYEQYDLEGKKVRLVHLQYKIWDKGTLQFTQKGKLQLLRQKKTICDSGFCSAESKSNGLFRLPYCSAFIRPTDKFQKRQSGMSSSGYHVPICIIQALTKGKSTLHRTEIDECSVNNLMFEELFNSNQIGSKWFPIEELDEHYKENNLQGEMHNILIYAQLATKVSKKRP